MSLILCPLVSAPAAAVAASGAFCHYSADARERKQGENCIMGTFSIWHWLIVLAVVLILFGGGGKLSRLMGDFGKGLKSFKKGMKEEPEVEDATKPVDEQKTLHSETADVGETTPPKDQAANS